MHINDGMKGYGSVVEDGPTGNNCDGGDRISSGNHGKHSPSDEPVLHRPLILSMKNQNHSGTHHTAGHYFPLPIFTVAQPAVGTAGVIHLLIMSILQWFQVYPWVIIIITVTAMTCPVFLLKL